MSVSFKELRNKNTPLVMVTPLTTPKYKDYYELLGLPRDVNLKMPQIKSAFMAKAMMWHPDKAPTEEDIPIYTKVYEDLQQAYKILSNEDSRRQYTDSQQPTNIDLVRQDRDLYCPKSEQYATITSKGYQFDRDKFVADFELTRDKEDRAMIEKLSQRAKAPVSKTEFEQYLKTRDEDIQIPNVFSEVDGGFNSNVFHQAFEYVKANQPSRGLEEFIGEPKARGLAETDNTFSGISFGNGLSLSGDGFNGVDIGIAFNPTVDDLRMFSENKERPTEQKMPTSEIESRIKHIQEDRDRLFKMRPEEYCTESSSLDKLYAQCIAEAQLKGEN
jgi:curved DNA-binding protein CbpA